MHLAVLLLLSTSEIAIAAGVNDPEQNQARRWIEAKFGGKAEAMPVEAYLMDHSQGARLMKNMVTTKVYYVESGALPLKIVDKVYPRGLFCPSMGSVVVHLPRPAKSFEAIFGVDSNRVTSFYSNAGRGRVIGSVKIGDQVAFKS
jgi:hypothetical protein